MKSTFIKLSLAIFSLISTLAVAQTPENVTVNNNDDFPDFTKVGTPGSSKPATKPAASTTTPTQTVPANSSGGAVSNQQPVMLKLNLLK